MAGKIDLSDPTIAGHQTSLTLSNQLVFIDT